MGELKYFFSYARKDSEFVLKLAKELRDVGVNLWLDQLDILGGQRWDREVEEALKTSRGMIAVLSPESVASNNVMNEVSYALEEGRLVVPILLHPCDKPSRLRRLQHIDFTAGYDTGFSQLLRALGIDQPSQPRTQPLKVFSQLFTGFGIRPPSQPREPEVTEAAGERPIEAPLSERPPIRTEPAESESLVIEEFEPPYPKTPTVPKGESRRAKKTRFPPEQPPPLTKNQISTILPEHVVVEEPAGQAVAEPVREKPSEVRHLESSSGFIFFSYARKDKEFALKLAKNLKDRGVNLWVDEWNLPLGADYDREIDKALDDCRTLLIILSTNSLESLEVRGELLTALDSKKKIVPVLYEGVRVPRQLRVIHYIDFTGSDPDDDINLEKLIVNLK
ncbi:MAG: TIR domain-containing protein [Desulfobaccales bacterium]